MKPHVAVILAAGGSTRLGQPKQLLKRDGETLVRRAVRLASATSPARLLVVVGAAADGVVTDLQSVACEIVENSAWADGLASSLRAVATQFSGFDGPVLILGCDQPRLEQKHLAKLLEGVRYAASGAAATLHAGLPGIPAIVPATWFSDHLLDGDRGFGRALRELPPESLFLLDDAALEADLDTSEDVAAAIAGGWLDPF